MFTLAILEKACQLMVGLTFRKQRPVTFLYLCVVVPHDKIYFIKYKVLALLSAVSASTSRHVDHIARNPRGRAFAEGRGLALFLLSTRCL